MKKRFVQLFVVCMVTVIMFCGCNSKVAETSSVEVSSRTIPTELADYQLHSETFLSNFGNSISDFMPELSSTGVLLPPLKNGKIVPKPGDLLRIDLILPNGWTMRVPEFGEGIYADGLYAPINIYNDGECIGTVGYGDFTADTIERWDGDGFDGEPIELSTEDEYKAIYWSNPRWLHDYLPIAQKEFDSSATCKILYSAEELKADKDYYNKGILHYDKTCSRYIGIELQDGAATDEQLAIIAKSIRLLVSEKPAPAPLPVPVIVAPSGYNEQNVDYLAYQDGSTENSGGATPFTMRLSLPDGWTVRKPEKEEQTIPLMAMEIYNDDTVIGSVGYMTFEISPGTNEENFHRMIYNQLMLGSVINWDNDYTPVTMTETACTATCQVMVKYPKEGQSMAEAEEVFTPAILSYEEKLLVYIGMSFEQGAVTDEQLAVIAKSIRLLSVQ